MASLRLADWSTSPEERLQKNQKALRDLLDKMSPEARQRFDSRVAPQLISDPTSIQTLYKTDYLQKPVRIEQFMDDSYYLGRMLRDNIFPKVRTDLIELFEGEYFEVLLKGSIGWGKSLMAEVGIAYDIYRLSCLNDPAAAFGLIPGASVAFVNISVNKTQAQKILFSGVFNLIERSPYFTENFRPELNIASEIRLPRGVSCYPVAASEQSLLGEGVFSAAFDELNFYAVVEKSRLNPEGGSYDQAEVLYNRLSRRIRSRMNQRGRLPGHLWLISSARYPNDFTERKSVEALRDERIFVREYSAWETRPRSSFMSQSFRVEIGDVTRRTRVLDGTENPDELRTDRIIEVPIDFKQEFEKDPDGAARDYGGYSVLSVRPFIARREKIAAMFGRGAAAGLKSPYSATSATLQNPAEEFLIENFPWIKESEVVAGKTVETRRIEDGPYYAHIDLAKSIDACGFAVGHVCGSRRILKGVGPDQKFETRPLIRIDFILQIIAPPNGEIIISAVRGLLYKLRDTGVQFGTVSYDSWGSDESIQTLNAEGFTAEKFSVDTDTEPYEQLKAALYDDRIVSYYHPILERELATLRVNEKEQKVDHPPHGSKDVADAVAGVVHHCEKGFTGGATSQWRDFTTVAPVSKQIEDEEEQNELWEMISRGIPLSEEQISKLK